MPKVMTSANESGFDYLFRWHANGDVETPTANPKMTLRTSVASAAHLRELYENTGALVVGRHRTAPG